MSSEKSEQKNENDKNDVSVDQSVTLGHEARQLTEVESSRLLSDTQVISPFWQQKYEKEAKKNWDLFYKRNLDKFFKDRNWTMREFQELLDLPQMNESQSEKEQEPICLLEAGCGVGNFIWPLVKMGLKFRYYGCDFSPVALEIFKKNPLYIEQTMNVFQADLTEPDSLANKLNQSVCFHVVSLIFVLSAIHPDKMLIALTNIHKVLHEDGVLIFRDYGLYDHAMLRFAPGHKLDTNFYVRQDGTRAYYFSKETLHDLVSQAGFDIIHLEYVQRKTINQKEDISVPRIFVQGKFKKKKLSQSTDSN